MSKYVVAGGNRLVGEVKISGAKNSALPIIAACLLTEEQVRLDNVPNLKDIKSMVELLTSFGAKVVKAGNESLEICAARIDSYKAPADIVTAMRASVLVMGPMLAQHGRVEISLPGGCNIGKRPIDLHIQVLESLGAKFEISENLIIAEASKGLTGSHYVFPCITVGGSENALMAAVLATGTTVLENVACEPEITDLCNFLVSLGAKIDGINSSTLTITGVKKLSGAAYRILPDRIEAGTYLLAAAVTQGSVTATHASATLLEEPLNKLRHAGADISYADDWIKVSMHQRPQAVDIVTAAYPKFPTDLQAQFMTMNAIAVGQSTIEEKIFENRFQQVASLNNMGAKIIVKENKAIINGVTSLHAATVQATDLRASASLVLAGLCANGKTIIKDIMHTDRGYSSLEEKLTKLGANITRV